MNSPQALAQMNRSAAEALGKAAAELDDKITWRPLDKGSSALEQVLECAGFARLGTHVFTHLAVPPMDQSVFERLHAEHGTPDKALALLRSAADEFGRAIKALPADKQQAKVTLPFGGGMEKSLAEIALRIIGTPCTTRAR